MNPWQGIHEFVAVAEHLSFSSAAHELELSTAQISRQIKQLEHQLGVQLFYRTTRKVTLTEAGRTYFDQCAPLIDGLRNATQAVTQLQTTPQGELRITAPITYGEQVILPLITQFLNEYPEITVHCELSNKTVDIIEEGYDIAIRIGRIHDESLIAKSLGSRHIITCASPEYIKRHGTLEQPQQLKEHTCLVGNSPYWRFNDAEGERIIKVQGHLRCNSGKALTEAAIEGLGIVHLPTYYVNPAINAGQLIQILNDYTPQQEGLWAIYPPGRQLSPKVKILIDYLLNVEKISA